MVCVSARARFSGTLELVSTSRLARLIVAIILSRQRETKFQLAQSRFTVMSSSISYL